jgi:DNA-binding transcriptional LysR family regulator
MNKLAAMQSFVSIVDQGSLTSAAAALGKALPTIVRSLAVLEEELGVRLLRRTTRRMSLTQEGRIYLDRCRRILADVEEAEQAVSNQHSEPRGSLRVTAPVLFGHLRIAAAIARFLKAHDQVEVDLLLLDRVVNLVEEGIDVAVRIAPLADSSMIATRVGEVRRVVVASPELLLRVRAPRHPRDLADKPAVHFHGFSSAPSWDFMDKGRSLSVPIAGRFSCNHAATAVDACAEGLGFGRFLSYQVESLIEQKRLRVVLTEFEPAPIPVHLVFAHARLLSPRIQAFVDWMKAELK